MDKVEKVARALGAALERQGYALRDDDGVLLADIRGGDFVNVTLLAAAALAPAAGQASVRPQFLATEDGEFNGNTHEESALAAMGEREATGANSAQVEADTSLQKAQRSEEPVAWRACFINSFGQDVWHFFEAKPAGSAGAQAQPLYASPRPEAVGEDWRAVDDAIWFYLGHENHKPEDSARLRRMSGVVLGLAGYAKR